MHDEDWLLRAACREADVELFYSLEEEAQQRAMSLCEGCEVRSTCLEVAMRQREAFGVWGGTPEAHRRRIFRRERRRPRAA